MGAGSRYFLIGTFREAGFPPDDAARLSFVDFGLSMAQQRALLLDLDPEARDSDASNAAAFRTADPARYPNIAAAADIIALRTATDSFELALSLMLGSIAALAPAPCNGHEHSLRTLR